MNAVSPKSVGVNVAFDQLVYEALIVTDCPASILPVFVVIVQPAAPVTTVHEPIPVQSDLQ